MESKRLKFYPPSLKDQPQILAGVIESKSELEEFLPWVPFALTESDSIQDTQNAMKNFKSFTNELRFSLYEKNTQEFVGCVGLIIRNKKIPFFEIGYWLRSSMQGKGYITEAVNEIERYAFIELNGKRIEIQTAMSNLKSIAVAKRCGYELEAKLFNHRLLPSWALDGTLIYAKTTR